MRSGFHILRRIRQALAQTAARKALLAALLVCTALAAPAAAQVSDAALLAADEVLITTDNRLVARGNVEAFYEGRRLYTDELIYDQDRDELIIPGPVRISDPGGDVILADSADLDSKLENGILNGARYVLNEELQILSAQTDRVEGRYTVLRKVIATSCQICGNGPPIWQIRSQRAIHDRDEKQIYFKRAQFRFLGVPVLYLPRLRIPDPTNTRATGFLIPRFVSNTELGFGVKLPYFIKIGDHADLTVTPFATTTSQTLELRYRKQFYRGYVEFNGAVSQDQVIPDTTRYYLTGFGAFNLGQDLVLSLDVEAASDAGYRTLYGFTGRDRLGSGITLSRVKRNVFFSASLFNFETLRENETNDTLPTLIGDLRYARRYRPERLGGEISARLHVHGHKRVSLADDIGRDMSRVNVDFGWQRNWTLSGGLRFGLNTNLGIDRQVVRQDSTFSGRRTDVTPAIAATLRYPLQARAKDGATYLLEPIAQIGWAGGRPSTLPNDESISQELDEGNLLSLSRFPALDRRETGTVGAVGFRWARLHSASWSAGVTLGTVLRETDDPAFSRSSGMSGLTSDLLIAAHYRTSWGAEILARGLFDQDLEPVKTEARFSLSRGKLGLSGSYVQLKQDPDEIRTASVAEWSLDSTYTINSHWTISGSLQYDLLTDRLSKTGGKIAYANECISLGLGATRSFAASSTLIPATTYELAISLNGFTPGASGKAARRKCRTQ